MSSRVRLALKIYLVLQAAGFIGGFVYGYVRERARQQEPKQFTTFIADMTTTVEEDVDILAALKDWFDNNADSIGHDGYTSWEVE